MAMSMMAKFWRTARLGLLIIMFVGSAFYLVITTPWAKYFGKPMEYPATLSEGQPIVDAVYRFKAERGLWPEYLDQLSPQYLKDHPTAQWNYDLHRGGPTLAKIVGPGRKLVGFDFDPVAPTWREIEGSEDRVLKKLAPPPATTLPAETVTANELRELDRRIKSDDHSVDQYRAKASLLRSLGRLDEARAVIKEAAAADGNHFWPRLAEVAMDLEGAPPSAPATGPESKPAMTAASAPALPASLKSFEKWVYANPTFTHLYYLAEAYRMADRNAEALAVIEEAAGLPPEPAKDDMDTPAFYLWDMTRFALSQNKWDLVLKLTGIWEKMQSDNRVEESKEYSYLALAAAAKLAKSDFGGAAYDMKTLKNRKMPTWAKNWGPLEDAIGRKDTAFRYDPGSDPPAYQVFAVPE